jgi:hypothetical protein
MVLYNTTSALNIYFLYVYKQIIQSGGTSVIFMHIQKRFVDCPTISAHIQNNTVGWCTEKLPNTCTAQQFPHKFLKTCRNSRLGMKSVPHFTLQLLFEKYFPAINI